VARVLDAALAEPLPEGEVGPRERAGEG
jgi:hypothetical protein